MKGRKSHRAIRCGIKRYDDAKRHFDTIVVRVSTVFVHEIAGGAYGVVIARNRFRSRNMESEKPIVSSIDDRMTVHL